MCLCDNMKTGSYKNKTVLKIPKELNLYKEVTHVTVDTCMVSEILDLWAKGIGTYGCCCGHNKHLPMINIREEDLDKVAKLGYVVQTNFNGRENIKRVDTIYPKTIEIKPQMIEHIFDHIKKYMEFKKNKRKSEDD